MLVVQLLGAFRVARGAEYLEVINSPRLRALFAYLVLYRQQTVSRQQLAYAFWPDSSDTQARTNLRNLYHRLRQAIPWIDDLLVTQNESLVWRAEASLDLDVALLEQALSEAGQAGSHHEPVAQREALHQAVELYRGDLLPGCYDDWVASLRERLRLLYVDALSQLVALEADCGQVQTAIPLAQQLVRHDPFNEASHRQLMRLYALSGARALALRAYHQCASTLQAELGVSPDHETQALYRDLVGQDAAPEVERTSSPPTGRRDGVAPVGRELAWSQLQAAWRQAQAGLPTVVVIAGEAGIGKSHLADAFMASTARLGATTARARAHAGDEQGALGPAAALLRSEALRPGIEALDDVWRIEIARLLPDLLAVRPDLERSAPLREGWQRHRFFEGLARGLLAAPQPLLIMLDDLQWCDAQTLAWLRLLLRHDAQAQMLLLGTYRVEELSDEHPLALWLADMSREQALQTIALEPLDADQTAGMAQQRLGHALSKEDARDLYDQSEGNPLYIVEALGTSQAGLASAHRPSAVQAVISRRLATLSSGARSLVDLAATIGRTFAYPLLASASGLDEDSLVQQMDELWQRRVIREQGEQSYDFSHDRIREAAYASLSAARRRLLHRHVADALEQMRSGDVLAECRQIARHLESAGQPLRAIPYHQQAAQAAMDIYAVPEAIAGFERALALSQKLGLPWTDLVPIYMRLTEALEWGGRFDQAWDLNLEMEAGADQAGDHAVSLHGLLSRTALQAQPTPLHDLVQGEINARQALERARAQHDGVAEANALKALLSILSELDRSEEAIACGELALSQARRMGSSEEIASLLSYLGFFGHMRRGDLARAKVVLAEASHRWRDLAHSPAFLDHQDIVCHLCLRTGEYDQVLNYEQQVRVHSRATGNVWAEASTSYASGLVLWDRGKPSEAIKTLSDGITLGKRSGWLWADATVKALLAQVYAGLGDYGKAMCLAKEALAFTEAHLVHGRLLVLATMAQIQVWFGLSDQALRTFECARQDPHMQAHQGSWTWALLAALEVAVEQAHLDLAWQLEHEVTALSHQLTAGMAIQLFWLRARLQRAHGDKQAASQTLVGARAWAEEIGVLRILWRILYTLSQWADDADEAAALLLASQHVIGEIADNIWEPDLRRSYLAQPRIRQVLDT